ncbi:hypothetical protein T459_24515 [Capsicum annuum]|uniref:Uncharacterized protein n=1 Tax=Capsicum annuum TaxID=4072 RepID=A0A2G2YVD8_CAPAN|nr:hypothetical protein T459_24515 [Capsicum annuum]
MTDLGPLPVQLAGMGQGVNRPARPVRQITVIVNIPSQNSTIKLSQIIDETVRSGIQLYGRKLNWWIDSVPGEGELITDMTRGMQLIREFFDLLVISEKATKIRIVQSIKLASNLSVSQEAK